MDALIKRNIDLGPWFWQDDRIRSVIYYYTARQHGNRQSRWYQNAFQQAEKQNDEDVGDLESCSATPESTISSMLTII